MARQQINIDSVERRVQVLNRIVREVYRLIDSDDPADRKKRSKLMTVGRFIKEVANAVHRMQTDQQKIEKFDELLAEAEALRDQLEQSRLSQSDPFAGQSL
jgi:leucyl-tRNA synthetase